MKEFNLDLSNKSQWYIRTPDEHAMAFPFQIYECGFFDAGPGFMTRSEATGGFFLTYTVAGRGEMKQASARCELQPGEFLVIDVDKAQEHSTLSSEPWKYHWIWFGGDGMKGFEDIFLGRLSPIQIRDESRMSELFFDVEQPGRAQAPLSTILDNQFVTELLSQAACAYCEQRLDIGPGGRVSDIMEYIARHLADELTIDELSRQFAISKFHLIRVFRSAVGVTPYQYIISSRINRGQILLRTTGKPVQIIGEEVGYPDPSSFTQQFKKVVGISPAEYRRQNQHRAGHVHEQAAPG